MAVGPDAAGVEKLPDRAPEAGSAPRSGPGHAQGAPVDAGAQSSTSWWRRFLPPPETGVKIFGAGLATLLLCICGLIVVGIRRRQW